MSRVQGKNNYKIPTSIKGDVMKVLKNVA